MAIGGFCIAAILAAVIFFDLKTLRIPHLLILGLLVLWLIMVPAHLEWAGVMWRLVAALVVLALGLAAFAARLLGGGDVKLLAVLTLFLPLPDLAIGVLLVSAGVLVTLPLIRLARGMLAGRVVGWAGLVESRRYPLGPAIALAGLVYIGFGARIAQAF